MKLAFINDTDGRENIGCRLTSSRFKAELNQAAKKTGLAIKLTSCPWKFNKSSTPALPYTSFALGFGRSVLSSAVLRELSIAEYGREAIDALEDADVALYHPEGSISDDNNAFRILRQICLPLYARVILKKPLIIANGTFPLFKDFRSELLESLVSLSDGAFFRDRLSTEHFGGDFCPDAAVTWPGAPVDKELEKRPYLLITTAAHASVENDRAICRNALGWCKRHGMKPLVLTKGWERLEEFRGDILSSGGKFLEYATLAQTDEILNEVGLHVGGRYHMAIFCATKGIPSWLVVSNTHKNRWLARDFGGISILDKADADLDAAIRRDASPDPAVITDTVAVQVDLFEQQAAKMIQVLESAARNGPSGADLQAFSDLWSRPDVRSELRANYFRDSSKVVLRAMGLMKQPKNHFLPT